MSDTPRTDQIVSVRRWEDNQSAIDTWAAFARQLERELHAMTLRCHAADRTANEALASRPEGRAYVPIKVRPMLVSGMLVKDERGPVILLDSEQDPRQQVLTFWHEVLHLVGLVDEVQTEETAMVLAGACPTILRKVCHNINVPDSGLGMNSGGEKR